MLEDKSILLNDKSDSMVVENFENIVEVFIEISKGSNIKYEFDKEKKCLVCDRILYTPFRYIFNYGLFLIH